VDPEIAKYKAMMRQGDTTDYTSGEFLGEQGQAQARKSATTKKKWGKPIEHSVDEWMGASPGKQRKSYVVKSKPKTVVHHDDEKEKETTPVHSPVTKTATLAAEPKEDSTPSSPVKAAEVDPEIAKYKAMMRQGDTTDYTSGEFLGEQGQAQARKSATTKKKWGKPIEKSNDDWLGSSPVARKSYVVKGSSSKPLLSHASPVGTRASFSPMASPKITSPRSSFDHASPVSAKERMGTRASFSAAMTMMHSPKVISPRTSLTHESPVSAKERMAGRASFSNAFSKFKSNDTALPAAFATSVKSPTKRNFRVSKEAKEKEAHRHDDEPHHEPTIQESDEVAGLHDEHKEEFEEALKMLLKIFNRLDDREPSWKQMDAVIKKIKKATKQGADIKAILSYSITSLQHIAGLLYDEEQSDTDDVVEKLIDLNMQL